MDPTSTTGTGGIPPPHLRPRRALARRGRSWPPRWPRHAVTDAAYFAARDSPTAVCVDMVAQSDVYVGIIGPRCGPPVRDRPDVLYTERESRRPASTASLG